MLIQPSEIALAVQALQAGEVVAIPTETVYGLAADISQEAAVEKIFALKNRPSNHPLIIHIGSMEQLRDYAVKIPDYVYTLAEAFWPGPLSFVLPKSEKVGKWVTGGQETVAIRMPNHPLTLSLIQQLGHPLAAPSANKFGKISPTQVAHVIAEFGTAVKILVSEPCAIGIESTIVDATEPNSCAILRPGSISLKAMQTILGPRCQVYAEGQKPIRVSGALKSHYAPTKPTFLFDDIHGFDRINKQYQGSVYTLYLSKNYHPHVQTGEQMSQDPSGYANQLYHHLRLGDNSSMQVIAIESPPSESAWLAIIDRLGKCSANSR